MKGEKILITGGAGYLGRNLVKRYINDNEVTVYSRDEAKHYYLKKHFPQVRCVIGDVRDLPRLRDAARGHTIGIFAASLKQIEAVDQNVEEAIQTIIIGALNSRRVATENNFKAATFISTDKSRGATTLYGAMKFVGGESFIVNAECEKTLLSSVIYGNVFDSTGSIIPLMWNAIRNKYELKLYGENMTRFLIEVDHAMDCVDYALKTCGSSIVPKLKSLRVKDLFEIYSKEFGLKWALGAPRISEKEHEQMLTQQEAARTTYDPENEMYLIHYKDVSNTVKLPPEGYSSEHHLLTKDELRELLRKHDFFEHSPFTLHN